VKTLAVFAGAFRSWHGAINLVEAMRVLRDRRVDVGAVLIGDGAELPRVRAAARNIDTIVFTGAIAHDRMPAALAAADIGVAPFDLGAHAPLSLGFYWSPLKIFEYMASGLPVLGSDRAGATLDLVFPGINGCIFDPEDTSQMAQAMLHISSERVDRVAMGRLPPWSTR